MPNVGKKPTDDNVKKSEPAPAGARAVKEHEPAEEAVTLGKIQEIAKEADLAAEAKVKEAIGQEARLSQKEPEIGPDLEDHGVKSPQAEASKVLESGSTIQLPITEEEYRQAEKTKIDAHTDEKKDVLGISSVVALAMWIGKIIKLAPGKAIKVIFRKPSSASSFAEATDDKKTAEGKGGDNGSVGQ